MTEPWKKKDTNYYCEYCNAWMADNPATRAVHERGVKHKDNVAKRLRDMRTRADQEKKTQAHTDKALAAIEASAQKQYEADKKAEEQHRQAQLGTWEFQSATGYYYNAVQRWYYDRKTEMYYGGDPPNWNAAPNIPVAAKYGAEPGNKPPPPRTAPPPRPTESIQPQPRAHGVPVSNLQSNKVKPGGQISKAHPLANVGGYQMPTAGKIGGAKGAGEAPDGDAGKRKRDGGGGGGGSGKPGKPISKEEADALARRDAARKRVEARTMAAFGLQ